VRRFSQCGRVSYRTLSLRLSSPTLLIDINRVADSAPLEHCDGVVRCGARIRHVELERSTIGPATRALAGVGHAACGPSRDPQSRHSLRQHCARRHPAAEIPACALALNADIVLQNSGGRRTVPAEKYFIGLYETARLSTEVVVELRFPAARSSDRFGFAELSRRRGDFAIVGIAAAAHLEDNCIRSLRPGDLWLRTDTAGVGRRPRHGARPRDWRAADRGDRRCGRRGTRSDENAQGDAAAKRQQAYAMAKRVMAQLNGRAA